MGPVTFKASRLVGARSRSIRGRRLARTAEGTVVLPLRRLKLGLAESDPAHRAEVLVGLDREHVGILGRNLKNSCHDHPSFAVGDPRRETDRGELSVGCGRESQALPESTRAAVSAAERGPVAQVD